MSEPHQLPGHQQVPSHHTLTDTQWLPVDNSDYAINDSDILANGFDPELDLDLDRDSKRRRIARACDMCRKKKIKCDGKMPKCSHCENYKTECAFTQVEKKRAPPKGAKYIEGLENRLVRMESLLRLTGLLGEDDDGRTDLGTLEKKLAERHSASVEPVLLHNASSPSSIQSPSHVVPTRDDRRHPTSPPTRTSVLPPDTTAITSSTERSAAQPNDASGDVVDETSHVSKELDALADQMCSLITNNSGETRYIGSSSGFSIFSPRGIQWVNERTGDSSFQETMSRTAAEDKHSWDHWKPEVFNDIFTRPIFRPLPSKPECCALLKDYFEHFNQMFPLFHEPTFMHLVDIHYSNEPFSGSGWWASLNVALAIAHRLRVMSNVVGREEDDHAWGYLKNAMGVLTELTMRNNDLFSVQALLGMALFLQGTPNPQPSFFLTAAAIRLSHSIGLHKRGSDFNLNDIENEQRKRVFWIAYIIDKDICLRSGRPPTQDDDDMNVELPSEDPPDNVGNVALANEESDGRKTMNLFRLMCTFSRIQSAVYKRLYSVKASRQSDGELLNTIGDLDAELEAWKDSIPSDFRPDHEIKAAHSPLILHVVVLHFAYYNCLTTIHRMSVHHGYWTSRLSNYAFQGLNAKSLNPRVYSSAALCVSAARASIGLIRYIPQGDYACVWMVLYYPVSALVTLFANILQNPQDSRARSDVKLMSSVVAFLTMLEEDVTEAGSNVTRMLAVCAEFERIAKVVLDKSEQETRARGKRKVAGGVPQTEREKEKALRERGAADISLERGLAEGKTLEQLQMETQAHYRRPVQTPSLRASIGPDSQSLNHSLSPNSWSMSPAEAVTTDSRVPIPSPSGDTKQQHNADLYTSNEPWNHSEYSMDNNPSQPTQMPNRVAYSDNIDAPGFGSGIAPFPQTDMQPTTMYGVDSSNMSGRPSQHVMNGVGGSFQQPFVPQDLWQMPMTLEWDWAEGLGLGSFTSGNSGLYDHLMYNNANYNAASESNQNLPTSLPNYNHNG